MLINGIEYELKPLEEGDEDLIEGKVGEYDHSVALPVPGAEEETLYFKITDGDGRIIAGCILSAIFQDHRRRRQNHCRMHTEHRYVEGCRSGYTVGG